MHLADIQRDLRPILKSLHSYCLHTDESFFHHLTQQEHGGRYKWLMDTDTDWFTFPACMLLMSNSTHTHTHLHVADISMVTLFAESISCVIDSLGNSWRALSFSNNRTIPLIFLLVLPLLHLPLTVALISLSFECQGLICYPIHICISSVKQSH